MSTPIHRPARPSIWEDRTPKALSRQDSSLQWFSDPYAGGSPFLSRQNSGTSQSSPRTGTPSSPRTYGSLNRYSSPAPGTRRPASPSASTPRRTATPQRAQTPRQHHTASSLLRTAPSPTATTKPRAMTPTRVEASYLRGSGNTSNSTPDSKLSALQQQYWDRQQQAQSHQTNQNQSSPSAPSPYIARLFERQKAAMEREQQEWAHRQQQHQQQKLHSDALESGNNSPVPATHTQYSNTPTTLSVDSFTSAGLTEGINDSSSVDSSVNNDSFLRRPGTPTSNSSSYLPRSQAPVLASLHTPKSVVPTPATPTFVRRMDPETPTQLHRAKTSSSYDFPSPSLSATKSSPSLWSDAGAQSSSRPTTPRKTGSSATPTAPSRVNDIINNHRAALAQNLDMTQFQHQQPTNVTSSSRTVVSGTSASTSHAKSTLRNFVSSWSNKYKENSKCYKEGGYLTVNKGDCLNDRYEMLQKLGWGEFSTVWLARDRCPANPAHSFVAVKIAKCHHSVSASTKYEINLLRFICGSSKVTGPITRLLDTFEHRGQYGTHVCMVMPVMGANLLCIVDQMKSRRRQRTDKELNMLKDITAAMLRSLDSLESINVVHTDIKPENVLVAVPDPKMVKLAAASCDPSKPEDVEALKNFEQGDANSTVAVADFGLSFLLEHPSYMPAGAEKVGTKKDLDVQYPGIANNKKGILIQTREYRAPEVLFGGTICSRADVWSVGCMVYELITGDFLLDPKRKTSNEREMDVEHVAMIMRILGPVPAHIAKQSQNPAKHLSRFFDAEGRFIHSSKTAPRRSVAAELEVFLEPAEAERAAQFIMSCFTYDPLERCHARDLLNHSWLRSTRNRQ